MIYLPSVVGGLMIGLAAVMLYGAIGRIAGISGISFGLLWEARREKMWRGAFIVGLIAGGWLAVFAGYSLASATTRDATSNIALLIAAGLLVGIGTRIGNGCTSGHGICGLARLSPRSFVAVMTFMTAGIIVATLIRPHLI